MITVPVYPGTAGLESFRVNLDGNAAPLAGVVRVDVVAGCRRISSESGAVTFTTDTIAARLGDLPLLPGRHDARIEVFRSGDTRGTVIAGPGLPAALVLDVQSGCG